jgi:hypothetical protein
VIGDDGLLIGAHDDIFDIGVRIEKICNFLLFYMNG